MNNKSFNFKEFLLFILPVLAVDLLIQILVFKFEVSVFRYMDPLDLILARKKSVYFLIVGYLIAVAVVPINFYKPGVGIKSLFVDAFWQTFVTLAVFSISILALFDSFAGRFFLQEGVLATICIFLWHFLFRQLMLFSRGKGMNLIHSVIVGSDSNAIRLYNTLSQWQYFKGYKCHGFFSSFPERLPSGDLCLGDIKDLDNYLKNNRIRDVFCSINPAKDAETVNSIIQICENNCVDFFYVPNMDGYLHRQMSFSEIGHVTIIKLREEPLANPFNSFIKRLFDIVFSGLFLVLIYPFVWLFVAIGIKISSPGPILFRQARTGYKGQSFTMLKFRSMKVNVDADKVQATENDPRKTKFGNFLRKTSIDELPQFINVFRGDMSIIGPRPHMELHTETYNKLIGEYMVRHMVRPGLTGWAQVNGCRGETKLVSQMEDRVRHDIWYLENWSLWLDIKIVFMTVFQIFGGDKQAY